MPVAPPSVSGFTPQPGFSVTGTIADGEIITIADTGSRFGVKPNGATANVVMGVNGTLPDSRLTMSAAAFWRAEALSTEQVYPNATHSRRVTNITDTTPLEYIPLSGSLHRNSVAHIEWYNDWTMPIEGVTPNVKWMRWEASASQANPYTVNTFQGATQRYKFSGDAEGEYATSINLAAEYSTRRWRKETQFVQKSSATAATDGNMYINIDGRQRATRLNVDSHKGFDPAAWPWIRFKPIWMLSLYWPPAGAAPFFFNLIYLDDSWCMVVLTDSDQWTGDVTMQFELQLPLAWQANQVQARVRQAGFASLAGKHLWIQTDDKTRLYIGAIQ